MVAAGAPAKAASNWMQGEIRRRLKDLGADDMAGVPVSARGLAELVTLTDRGVVSSTVAKDVFDKMWSSGRTAAAIIETEGLGQIGDEAALAGLVQTVVDQNPDAVAECKAGRNNVFGFLVGQVMKASRGKANPKVVGDLLRKAMGP
jgi:aspartyl-tRNA(Asn)/glutamyl-tRNA(Gln) amidotransferase subunit B